MRFRREQAMLLNLTDVFTNEGRVRKESVAMELKEFKSRMGVFPIAEQSPLKLTITNEGMGKALIKGHAVLTQLMSCDRCLKEVRVPITIDFERTVASPDVRDDKLEDDGDFDVMEGYQLNVDVLVYNELLMNQPEKVLCKPDCKGICMKCGKDLNEGECGCDTFVPDPRMAVLQDIFKANKEV